MSRIKRIALGGILLLGVGVGAIFFVRAKIAGWLVVQAIAEAQSRAAASGLGLSGMEPGRATLTGPLSLQCEGLRGRLVVPRGVLSGTAEGYAFVVRKMHVRVDGLWAGRVVLAVGGGSLYKLRGDGDASGEWLSDLHGEVVWNVSWRQPRESVAKLEAQMRRLLATGSMEVPARLRGRARFLVRRQWFEATVYSETDGRTTRIMLDREDVQRVSAGYAQPLTETEIDLVSRYPTLAPVLLQITDKARRVAAERRQAVRDFPEDAFRHVFWSYLLTRELGAELAEMVTDAHEAGATYEKGEADRRMDLQNNAVGRDYAAAGLAEHEVESRMLADVRVVKRAR